MRTFVIGDIHGGYLSLKQCLERSSFNYEEDTLISLGDICDGWPETKRCIDELLKIKNIQLVRGNHDNWALDWMLTGQMPNIWTRQGGEATLNSYGYSDEFVPASHKAFLNDAPRYRLIGGKVFMHGGFDPNQHAMSRQRDEVLMWDRDLIYSAHKKHQQKPDYKFAGFEEIYVGHTPVTAFRKKEPQHWCNLWAMDTGGGWEGTLTIMDVDTKQFWQSDLVADLYPGTDHARQLRQG